MSSPFVAEIRILPYNFPPTGWATCDGQLLPISQNTALFSLLGTFYGGDGKSTFALPDLQDSVAMQQGQGPGLSQRFLGESSGVPFVSLLTSEMPLHSHTLSDSTKPATEASPGGQYVAKGAGVGMYDTNAQPTTNLDPQALAIAGGSLPHNNMQPYLAVQYCIALQGVFPARS
jgi:microcystin-dependent protein